MTTANPVRTDRSLRDSRPFKASFVTYATAFIRSRTPSASVPAPSWTTTPSLQHHDPVGHRGGRGLVGDHDHGLVELVDGLAQQAQHLLGGVRVQVAGRLVGEQHGGPVHERARHGDALLLAAGELRRPVRQPVAQADRVDQLVEPLLVGVAAGERQRQDDVLRGGQDRDEVERLEDEAQAVAPQPRQALVVEAGQLLPVDHDGARRRLVEPGEQVHQRRLPGARRAHDRRELPLRESPASHRRARAPRSRLRRRYGAGRPSKRCS